MTHLKRKPRGKPFTGRDDPRANLSGRKKGVPNVATQAVKERAAWLFDAEYWDKLKQRVADGAAPHMETLFHHYLSGKPKETIEHQVPMRPVVIDLLQPGEGQKPDDD